jgi:hypothetical protein
MSDRFALRTTFTSLLIAMLAACGGESRTDDADAAPESTPEEAPAPAESEPAATPASDRANAPLTTADIDRWAKGMAGELEAVKEAGAKLQTAKTADDTMSAMMGAQDMNTASAGANAAGVDLERYKVIRTNLSTAASYLAPQLGGIDTTMLSPAQREEMRQMNATQLAQLESAVPKEVVEALRPRAAELRTKDLELVGARLKAAGQ